jgi:uncharacterized repeat protein (TIGR03803 family)
MRRICFVISSICILAGIGSRPAFGSDAASGKEKIIYSFAGGADGAYPLSDLTLDSAGNLYGTTSYGGSETECNGFGCGTVFELKRTEGGWKEELLYSFTGGNDSYPEGGVIFDKAGNLFGTTVGTVFKLAPNSRGGWTESTLYTFPNDGSAGSFPQSDLIFDAQGNLYGTTSQGGNLERLCAYYGCGTVFELTPQANGSWTETTIHAFTGPPDGGTPSSELVLGAGNFYGVTEYGGTAPCYGTYPPGASAGGCGTIYTLTHNSDGSWTESVLYNFIGGGGRGKHPAGGLLVDNPGHLIGTALTGGDGLGTVFELVDTKKRGWQENELHVFYGAPDGNSPIGRMIVDANGDLFGVTDKQGREIGNAIVFKLEHSENGWKEKIIHTFSNPYDIPSASLVSDSHGHLYGTTVAGGTENFGTVYEVTP